MGSLIVITAPSGAGKTTLIKRYMANAPSARFSVSHTTRAPRANEVNGKDYYFVTEDEFRAMIANNEFLEWAEVHKQLYGTSVKEVENAINGEDTVILDIDVQGALALMDRKDEALFMFIEPPSPEALKERLIQRGTDSEEQIAERLWTAKREIEYKERFAVVLMNDDLETTYKAFKDAIDRYRQTRAEH